MDGLRFSMYCWGIFRMSGLRRLTVGLGRRCITGRFRLLPFGGRYREPVTRIGLPYWVLGCASCVRCWYGVGGLRGRGISPWKMRIDRKKGMAYINGHNEWLFVVLRIFTCKSDELLFVCEIRVSYNSNYHKPFSNTIQTYKSNWSACEIDKIWNRKPDVPDLRQSWDKPNHYIRQCEKTWYSHWWRGLGRRRLCRNWQGGVFCTSN